MLEAMQTEIEAQFTEAERKKYLIDMFPEDKGRPNCQAAISLAPTPRSCRQIFGFIDHLGKS